MLFEASWLIRLFSQESVALLLLSESQTVRGDSSLLLPLGLRLWCHLPIPLCLGKERDGRHYSTDYQKQSHSLLREKRDIEKPSWKSKHPESHSLKPMTKPFALLSSRRSPSQATWASWGCVAVTCRSTSGLRTSGRVRTQEGLGEGNSTKPLVGQGRRFFWWKTCCTKWKGERAWIGAWVKCYTDVPKQIRWKNGRRRWFLRCFEGLPFWLTWQIWYFAESFVSQPGILKVMSKMGISCLQSYKARLQRRSANGEASSTGNSNGHCSYMVFGVFWLRGDSSFASFLKNKLKTTHTHTVFRNVEAKQNDMQTKETESERTLQRRPNILEKTCKATKP